MADDVHVHQTPPPANGGGGSSAGWVVAIVAILVLAVVAWLVFGRGVESGSGVPDEIDVEISTPANGN